MEKLDIDKKTLAETYIGMNMNISQIAKHFNVSKNSIRSLLMAYGFLRPDCFDDFDAHEDVFDKMYYKDLMSLNSIANHNKWNYLALVSWCYFKEKRIRTKSEQAHITRKAYKFDRPRKSDRLLEISPDVMNSYKVLDVDTINDTITVKPAKTYGNKKNILKISLSNYRRGKLRYKPYIKQEGVRIGHVNSVKDYLNGEEEIQWLETEK